jgi:hypothetical protein
VLLTGQTGIHLTIIIVVVCGPCVVLGPVDGRFQV